MKLSARLLVWHLRHKYDVAADKLSCQPYLRYAIQESRGKAWEEGIVYITDDPRFVLPAGRHTRFLVLWIGGPPAALKEENVCVLADGTSAVEVTSYLQRIFSKYEEWNQALFESRLAGASIQNLLDLTDAIIPNPMAVLAMDFTTIAAKGFPSNTVLGSMEETLEVVNALKNDPQYEEAYHRVGYFYYPGNDVAAPSLCVNIRRLDQTVYRLLITTGEIPLDDTFGFILEYLARIISHALATNAPISRDVLYPFHKTFTNLLTNPSADYVEVSRQLSTYGWLSSHFYQCVLIKTGLLDLKNLTLRSICGYVENTIPASCAVEYHGNAVVYINMDLCTLSDDAIAQKLAGFIRDSLLNAGYSRKLLGHFNFQRQYVQASIALQVGTRKHPSQWIHHFNDIALSYLLEQTTKKLPAYMVCHEKLLTLKYQSEGNQTQLYQTLRRYLENHQNITKTAQDLFIHRSTLLYRLKKIKEVMKSDFSDPEELLYLLLSYRLMDTEEEH